MIYFGAFAEFNGIQEGKDVIKNFIWMVVIRGAKTKTMIAFTYLE
jgi:hypothetical protein